jgi:hypothetical protein
MNNTNKMLADTETSIGIMQWRKLINFLDKKMLDNYVFKKEGYITMLNICLKECYSVVISTVEGCDFNISIYNDEFLQTSINVGVDRLGAHTRDSKKIMKIWDRYMKLSRKQDTELIDFLISD